jgi:putative transposase
MSRKSKYTTDQILAILREVAGGTTVRAVCKRNGFTEKTFYRWRARYGHGLSGLPSQRGPDAPDSGTAATSRFVSRDAELRRLDEENHRLKELVADLSLENRALKAAVARAPSVRLLAGPRDRR